MTDNFRILDPAPFEGSQPGTEFLVLPLGLLAGVRYRLDPGKLSLILSRFISRTGSFPVQSHELRFPVEQSGDLLRRLEDMGVVIDGLARVLDGISTGIPDNLPVLVNQVAVHELPVGSHLLLKGEMKGLHNLLKRTVEERDTLSPGGVIGDLFMIRQHDLRNPGDANPEFLGELPGRLAFSSSPGNLLVSQDEFCTTSPGHQDLPKSIMSPWTTNAGFQSLGTKVSMKYPTGDRFAVFPDKEGMVVFTAERGYSSKA